MFDPAAQQPAFELKPLAEFVYQPVAFERFTDMTDNLTTDDMVNFIQKLKHTYREAVDKIVRFLLNFTY